MSINKYIKKRMWLFSLTFIFIIILTVGSSIALLSNDAFQNGDKVVVGNLHVVYEKGSKKANDTKNYTAKKVVIKNEAALNNKYSLVIKAKNDNTMNLNKVMYQINDEKISSLGEKEDGVVYQGTLKGKEEVTLEILIFVSPDLIDATDQGKQLNLEYKVINQ